MAFVPESFHSYVILLTLMPRRLLSFLDIFLNFTQGIEFPRFMSAEMIANASISAVSFLVECYAVA